MSAIDLTRKAEYATIIQQFKLRAINSAGECHLHMVEVEGSNPPSPTMIADEKAARQKNHEKRTVFHGFLLFMRQKRVFMKSEVKIIF